VYSMRTKVTEPELGYLNNSKIIELFNTNHTGIYGNPERNLALALIPRDRIGWVYFLDDDNLMHENMWMVMQTKDTNLTNILLVGAQHCPDYERNRLYMPIICKTGKVDTGNALFSAQKVIHRKWKADRIDDGPFIVDTCNAFPSATRFLKLIASYHNGILCDNVLLL
jgi:hypothetical protein